MHFSRIHGQFVFIIIILKCFMFAHSYTRGRTTVNVIAKKLLESSMDLAADPCDDFYKYACGKWGEFHNADDDDYQELITLVDYYTNKDIGRHLKYLILNRQPQFIITLHKYYRSCVTVTEYEPLKYLRWLKEYEQIKWPALWTTSYRSEVEFDWLRTLAVMRRYGLNGIFVEQVILQKDENASITIIDLDKPVKNGGFELMTFRDLRLLIETLPEPIRRRSVLNVWSEINVFEKRLKSLENIQDLVGSVSMKIKDIPIKWLRRYLSLILEPTELDSNMEIYIQNLPYFLALDKLINEYEPRFICKYLEIRFLWFLNVQGPPNFTSKDCTGHIRHVLSHAVNWLFETIHPELVHDTENIKNLFQRLIMQFDKILTDNRNNFTSNELEFLLGKLHNIQLKVGNLPRVNTVETLERFYKDVDLNATDFYGNHLKLLKFNVHALQIRLQQSLPRNADEYFYIEEPNNEFYSSSPYFIQRANIVVVPLTMLQLPLYDANLNNIYKYSMLGFLMAHEIMHAFDLMGLNVDANGQMNGTLREVIVNNQQFDMNFNCLQALDPLVVDEKMADVSGLRLAYETYYTLYPDMRDRTFYLNGEELASPKIFLLNFAQFFCGSSLGSTEHGWDRDRLIDALLHFKQFHEIFKCPLGSRMYPNHHNCQLWRR